MKGFELTPSRVKKLKLLHKKQRGRSAADQIKAVVLLGTGWTLLQVSEALLLDTETLRSYVKKYREGGMKKVLERHYKSGKSRLSDAQKEELKQHLSETTYPDIASIIAHVESTYGVIYKPTGMRDLISKLGFVYKKPKVAQIP